MKGVISMQQKVNRTETDRLKSNSVFNLKPFSGFSSRWSRNIVEDFKNMGKTDLDQHQIDNHSCLFTFSKIMSGNRFLVCNKRLTEPKLTVKSNSVFNLKPFSGFSSRWSRNIVDPDLDQHQIDNHSCLFTFSKIMSGNRFISTTKPLTTEENEQFGV